jgi:hypothetical protein
LSQLGDAHFAREKTDKVLFWVKVSIMGISSWLI